MNIQILSVVAGLSVALVCPPVAATEYVYRELMANTLPASQCDSGDKAVANATKKYTLARYSKKFCHSQGYGWHVNTIKDTGKTACTPCAGGQSGSQTCHQEDVVVVCQRIKPGTVGLLPGKG